jgi:hypothetical protein
MKVGSANLEHLPQRLMRGKVSFSLNFASLSKIIRGTNDKESILNQQAW